MRVLGAASCPTLSYLKDAALTIRVDPALERQLEAVARASGRSKSEIVRDALRRQLAVARFEGLRRGTLPYAEARGYLTDEDVYRDVS
jgi:predicted transcriptional regulator